MGKDHDNNRDVPTRLNPSEPGQSEHNNDPTDAIRDALLDYRDAQDSQQESVDAEDESKILSLESARRWHKVHKYLAPGHRQKRGRRGSG